MEKTVEYYMGLAQAAVEAVQALGYDETALNELAISELGGIYARIRCVDDFQKRLPYTQHVQQYQVTLTFDKENQRFPTAHLLNREQRELHVLLKQQADSTVLRDELTSAAGRRFVEALCAERAKYAQLCDLTPQDEVLF